MPKESITSHDGATFQTAVGWSRDHEVQVAVQVADENFTLLDILYSTPAAQEDIGASLYEWMGKEFPDALENVDETLADLKACQEAGALILGWVEASRIPQERDGIWASLSRRACNEMIQLLRKGRDAAYGRDA